MSMDGLIKALLRSEVFVRPDRLVAPASWAGHIPFAFWLISVLRPRLLVELGTHTGNSYCAFCQAVRSGGLGTECHAVDLWAGDEHAGRYGDEIYDELRAYHDPLYGGFSRLTRSSFDQASEYFAPESIDLLHIDGLHTYEAVAHDFETWRPKLSSRGVVLLHDINVRERDFGVWRFWEEIKGTGPHFSFVHGHGLGILLIGPGPYPDDLDLLVSCGDASESLVRIREIFALLGNLLTDIVEARKALGAQGEELRGKDEALDLLRRQVEVVETEVAKRDAEIALLSRRPAEKEVQGRDEALAVLRRQVEILESEVAKRDVEIAVLSRRAPDEEVRALRRVLAVRDGEVGNLRRSLSDMLRARDREGELRVSLAKAEARNEELAKRVAEADCFVSRIREEKDRYRRACGDLRETGGGMRLELSMALTALKKAESRVIELESERLEPVGLKDLALSWVKRGERKGAPAREEVILAGEADKVLRIVRSGLFDPDFYRTQCTGEIGDGDDLPRHYFYQGALMGLDPHPLFNTSHYRRQVRGSMGENPLLHFLEVGGFMGLDPHPLFSSGFYLQENPDVAGSGLNPLVHFVSSGWRESRDPHPLFDTDFYLGMHPDVAESGLNPLVHFFLAGGLEGRDPHPLFRSSRYLEQYPALRAEALNPLVHYLSGDGRNASPHPLFDPGFYRRNAPEAFHHGEIPLIHYLGRGTDLGLSPHRLFDAEFYLRENPDVATAGRNPLLHFATTGWAEGRDPNPLFDTEYYLQMNPDVAAAGLNPLEHYLVAGGLEGRDPHPLFRSSWYLARHPELRSEGLNPLIHYLSGSGGESSTHPLFDPDFYSAQERICPDESDLPLIRYLRSGSAHGLSPHYLFDVRFYHGHSPDVAAAGLDPLVHYLQTGHLEGRNPHPLFDTNWYRRAYGDMLEEGENPLVHYLLRGWEQGCRPHPLFDVPLYLESNPGVLQGGLEPLRHFLQVGAAEGLDPHPLFDSSWYLSTNPDIRAASVNPLLHYIQAGAREGRIPHPLFDPAFYARSGDVSENPLRHYLEIGFREGRSPHPLFDPEFYGRRYPDVVAAGIDPLSHYVRISSRLNSDPHPLVLDAYVRNVSGDDASPLVALADPSRLLNPNPFFNSRGYAHRHGLPDHICPLAHWLAGGSETNDPTWSGLEKLGIDMAGAVSMFRADTDLSPLRGWVDRDLTVIILEEEGYAGNENKARSSIPEGCPVICSTAANLAREFSGIETEYVLIVDAGTRLFPGCAVKLRDRLRSDDRLGAVCPMVYAGEGCLASAGGMIWNNGRIWRYGYLQDSGRPEFGYFRVVDAAVDGPVLARTCMLDSFGSQPLEGLSSVVALSLAVRIKGGLVGYEPMARSVDFGPPKSLVAGDAGPALEEAWKYRRPEGTAVDLEKDAGGIFRVLVIDELLPTPDRDSGSITTLEFIRSLIRLGGQVSFYPRCQLDRVDAYVLNLQAEGVEVLYGPWVESLEDAFSRPSGFYDLVVLFRLSVGSNTIDEVRRRSPYSKIIYHTVDLHFVRTERERQVRGLDLSRLIPLDLKPLELGVIARADVSVVVSEDEKHLLGVLQPRAKVVNLPYIIEVVPGKASFEDRRDFLFLGGFAYPPNVDAVLYFVREVLPVINQELPEARFLVVGNAPPPEILALASDRIEVTGYVPDLRPWFERCRLSVSPLRYGAGIKGKVVMSMAHGVPCVVSTVASEGMGGRDGEHFLAADDPGGFARRMIRLYRDQNLWERMSGAALAFVRERYSTAAGDRIMEEVIGMCSVSGLRDANKR